MYRQGDVLIIPVASIPKGVTVCKKDNGRVILAYGEATGHAHAIEEDEVKTSVAELMRTAQGEEYLKLKDAATVTHEEHNPLIIPAGTFKIIHQREQSPIEGIRRVLD